MALTNLDYERIGEKIETGFKVYVHKKTFRIIALLDVDDFGDYEPEEDEEYIEIEENGSDYFEIEKMESRDFFKIMEDFAENLDDKKESIFFKRVLSGQKPMANFNHHIHQSDYRDEWFAHKKQAYIDYAKKEFEWQFERENEE
jgi:hypothetical protein